MKMDLVVLDECFMLINNIRILLIRYDPTMQEWVLREYNKTNSFYFGKKDIRPNTNL